MDSVKGKTLESNICFGTAKATLAANQKKREKKTHTLKTKTIFNNNKN